MGVGILLGVLMAYLAYRLFTSSSSKGDSGDVNTAIAGAIGAGAGAAATTTSATSDAGADMDMDMDMDTGMNAEGTNGN